MTGRASCDRELPSGLELSADASICSAGSRSLIKITLPAAYEDRQPVKDLVERLMGKDPAHRFEFIQRSAAAVDENTIDA